MLIFSARGRVKTPSDASMETSRRDHLSQTAISVVCVASLVLEKLGSENSSKGVCYLALKFVSGGVLSALKFVPGTVLSDSEIRPGGCFILL